jgi:hypothetical protein
MEMKWGQHQSTKKHMKKIFKEFREKQKTHKLTKTH